MQVGLVISVIMHAAILGWALFTIQTQRETRMPEPDPIVTGLVSESELTRLKQGVRTAKQLEALNKETPKTDVSKKESAKPKPVAAAPPPPPPPEPPAIKPEPKTSPKTDPIAQKLAEPPPPPPPAAEEHKQREAMLKEQARLAQEKVRAEEVQRAEDARLAEAQRKADEQRRAEEQRKADEQRLAEAQRKAEEQRLAEEKRKAEEQRQAEEKRKAEEERRAEEKRKAEEQRQAEEKRKADEQRQAELKKRRDDEKRRREAALRRKQEEERKQQEAEAAKSKFDADKISALLNKVPDKSAPPPSTPPTEPTKAKGPTLGAPEGRDKHISASEIAMLKGMISSRLKVCWRLPSGGGGSDTPAVTLRWRLKPDGNLDGDPQVEQPRGDTLFRLAAEAAQRAVRECAPFVLPADKYNTWRTITWEFDPSQMM